MSGPLSGIKVQLGLEASSLYYDTKKSKEGVKAFLEKRPPNFRKYTKTSD